MDKKAPLVSIIMPVYNCESYLDEAIKSMLSQTYKNIELIIADDGSADSSWDIIKKYADRNGNVTAIKNGANIGIPKTKNKCAKLAKGKYIAPMGADDISDPQRIEKEAAFLEKNPDYAVVGSNIEIIDEKGRIFGRRYYPKTHKDIMRRLPAFSPLAEGASLIRSSAFEGVGGYNERYKVCQDYDLWFKLLAKHKGHNLDSFLLKYRQRPGQQKQANLKKTLRNTVEIQKENVIKGNFFSFRGLAVYTINRALLHLPNRLVLLIFRAVFYRKKTA